MKLAAKVAGMKRIESPETMPKKNDLQERYKTKQTELDYLKIVRLVAAFGEPSTSRFSGSGRLLNAE